AALRRTVRYVTTGVGLPHRAHWRSWLKEGGRVVRLDPGHHLLPRPPLHVPAGPGQRRGQQRQVSPAGQRVVVPGFDGFVLVGVDAVPTTTCAVRLVPALPWQLNRKSTRLNSSHVKISYAVFCLKK